MVFATFDLTPLASASIGQAHAATLLDGSEVVVKVRRPGVVAQVDEYLELLNRLAVRSARRSEQPGTMTSLDSRPSSAARSGKGSITYARDEMQTASP